MRHAASACRGPALRMAVVIFPGFELLDVAAPGELLGATPCVAQLLYCAQHASPVPSSCMQVLGGTVGPSILPTHVLQAGGLVADIAGGEPFMPDALLVAGGTGVRAEVHNSELLTWLRNAGAGASVVFTVCTGSWLLGVAGLLDGVRATSNKNALRAGHPQLAAPRVQWQRKARWVEHEVIDNNGRPKLFLTSSGVSAGGGAALALIARRAGLDLARQVALNAEWTWQENPEEDPFTAEHGL